MRFKLKLQLLHKVNKARPKPRYDYSNGEEFKLLDTPDASDPSNLQNAESEWEKLKTAVTDLAH